MVGLDNAGKTTVLNKLKLGEMVNTIPTIGFNKNGRVQGLNVGKKLILNPCFLFAAHQLHSVGRGRSDQDPASVAALLVVLGYRRQNL